MTLTPQGQAWAMADGPIEPAQNPGATRVPQEQDPSLEIARVALERGDYGLVIRQLEPLCEQESGRTQRGGEARMLMATALLGQGQSEQATALCRQLRGCADLELRRQAKDLEEVLQAPGLERPKEWSLTLPSLGAIESTPTGLRGLSARRRQNKKQEEPPPPPVGRTQAPLGFAIAVILVLVLLTTLLGGCIRISTEVAFPAPGRLQISEQFSSRSGLVLPWQQDLEKTLSRQGLRPVPENANATPGTLTLRSTVLPAQDAIQLLTASLEAATALADLPVPTPTLAWREQNWVVGVQQHLELEFDLQALQTLPGLELNLVLKDTHRQAVLQAQPHGVDQDNERLIWPLQPGQINRLELRSWRWSRLGLGAVVVAGLLPVALLLQRQRWLAGFGWPELPA